MAIKFSRFQRLRQDAQELLDEKGLEPEAKPSRLRQFAHFWVLVWKSFERNRCPVRASALAYATLLALIPMLAVVMSITSSLLKQQGEDRINDFIEQLVASVTPPAGVFRAGELDVEDEFLRLFGPDPAETNVVQTAEEGAQGGSALASLTQGEKAIAARKEAAHYIHRFIQNTQSGALGITGTVLLIFAAISMLSRIEIAFNDIWGAAQGRSWFMRVVLYWGVISLVPILLVVALGLASGPHMDGTKELLTHMPFIGNLVFRFLPIVLLCLTFAAFYMLMPNTKVQWQAALVGGFVGGLLFHLNNLASVLYVSRVVSNREIYGSLAMVPVFMIGLYFAWIILLFGAQVAYAYQNRTIYLEEKQVENINQRGREFIALRLMTCVGRRFAQGQPPPNVVEMAQELTVPTRLIRQIMQTLGAARLVVETATPEPSFLPARPLEKINCHDVLLAMRATHGQELATRDEPTRAEVYGEFQRIQEAERQAAASVNLLALVDRAERQLQAAASSPHQIENPRQ